MEVAVNFWGRKVNRPPATWKRAADGKGQLKDKCRRLRLKIMNVESDEPERIQGAVNPTGSVWNHELGHVHSD